jgi:hypothetical protein
MYIPVPTTPPAPPSAEAQELGGHLADMIHAYQADHPEMSPLEVRRAVQLAQRAVGGGPNTKILIKSMVLGLVAFMALGLFFFRSNPDMGQIPWMMVTVVGLMVVVGVMAIVKNKQ